MDDTGLDAFFSAPASTDPGRAIVEAGKVNPFRTGVLQQEMEVPGNTPATQAYLRSEMGKQAGGLSFAAAAKPSLEGGDSLDSFFPQQPRSEASIVAGGVAAGAKAVARSVADFGDMFASIPGMALGSVADFGSRIQSLLEGNDASSAGRIAKGVRESVTSMFSPTPFRSLVEHVIGSLAPDEDNLTQSDVQKGMETISKGLERGGKWVEKKTGGVVTAETFDSLVNEAMALGGLKEAAAVAPKFVPKEGAPGAPRVEPDIPSDAPEWSARGIRDARVSISEPSVAAVEARRADARSAFAEDPQYADYLRNYAEEEARLRSVQPPDLATPGTPASPTPRAARTGSRGALEEQQLPPATAPAVDSGAPSALDSGLAKIRSDQAFSLTPEERIAVRSAASEWDRPQMLDEKGNPIPRQRGAADHDLLRVMAGLGLGTAAALYVANDQDLGKSALAAAAVFGLPELAKLPEATPLGAMLERSGYTLKTLDRLPQNRFEFTREQVMQQLNRPDVGKAEKDVILSVLGDRAKISAKDLMGGVKMATGDFELKAKPTDDYATYGLENIDRLEAPDTFQARDEGVDVSEMGTPPARTTIYQSPVSLGEANHFSDPNYFGHTRSFDEGGVRHVVEVQSDLAQKAGKKLAPDERVEIEKELAKDQADLLTLRSELGGRPLNGMPRSFRDNVQAVSVRIAENKTKLNESATADKVGPMLKDWPKRLIREELANVAREREISPGLREDLKVSDPERLATLNARPNVARFATADTVAKVEGWPDRGTGGTAQLRNVLEDGIHRFEEAGMTDRADAYRQRLAELEPNPKRFSPEHQPIYDRYKRDIEKFLSRDLGGKPYTDSAGHTWIEVPLPKRPTTGRTGGPTQMFGRADPKMLARLAALGLGAWAGSQLDSQNPIGGGLLGAFLGAVASSISPRAAGATFRKLASRDTRPSIAGLANEHETATRLAAIDTVNLQKQIEKLVPSAERRAALTTALEAGDKKGLTPDEAKAGQLARDFFDNLGAAGYDAGVLKGFVENYVTHLWDFTAKDKGLLDRWIDRAGGAGMSPKSPYGRARSIPTIEEGKAAGLKPLSEDISVIMGVYSNSMVRAIENAKLIDALKSAKDPFGANLVMAADKAPRSFVGLDHPQLRGLRVHPDIAPQMNFLFDANNPGVVMKVLQGVSDTSKRAAVSFSLFHAKALTDALIGGSSKWIFSVGKIPSYIRGMSEYLQELKKGSASPLVSDAVRSGLMFSVEKAGAATEDAGAGFYSTMESLQKLADRTIPYGGKAVAGVTKVNHAVDTLMWARLHAGMKLDVWAEKRGQLLLNSAKAAERNPDARILSRDEAGAIAASYTNDLFGGLNYRRIAMDAETRFGRALGEALLKPSSRRLAQLALFAPDWTLSTARAVTQALGKGSGVRGLLQPTTLADLHRQYILRSALYYFVVGDAINYATSGHHLWENKDWTTVDLGDGRRMQWSKHTMEPVHWVTKPSQQALNKLGFLPREALNQAMGTEYLSPRTDRQGNISAGPAMKSSRLVHLAHNFEPIAVQQGMQGASPTSALAGFAGAPIYGLTEEQKALLNESRKRARLDKAARGER